MQSSRVLLAVATALALSACAHAPLPAGARYVNMGSSFAAGAGTGATQPGSPARCYRSSANYARQLANRLALALVDVSCGGATSAHLIGPWNELPAQIEAVDSATRLVTITVGGNDVAYVGNLTAASCAPGEIIRVGGMALPCPAPFAVPEEAYARLEANLGELARQIAVRAPHARTVFIQYVTLVPRTQCAQSRFTVEEAVTLRATATRLAAITGRVARANGALVLPMDEASADHTPCDPDPWSVGLPAGFDATAGAPWHPNRRGMDAIAERLAALLAR